MVDFTTTSKKGKALEDVLRQLNSNPAKTNEPLGRKNQKEKQQKADTQMLRKKIIQEAKTQEFKEYIQNSSQGLFSLIYTAIRSEYPDEINGDDIREIEEFFLSCQDISKDELKDFQKSANVANKIHEKLIKIVEQSKKDLPDLSEQQYKNLTLQQLDSALKANAKKGAFKQIAEFIEEKTGGLDLNQKSAIPNFVMKKFGMGGDKKDDRVALDDGAVAMEMIGVFGSMRKTTLGDKLFALILGGSMVVGLGYLILPILPLIIARKGVPSEVVPLLGGLTVDSIIAEKTLLNPIDKNTVREGCPPLAETFVNNKLKEQSKEDIDELSKDNFSLTNKMDDGFKKTGPGSYDGLLRKDVVDGFKFNHPPHIPSKDNSSEDFAQKQQLNDDRRGGGCHTDALKEERERNTTETQIPSK